MNRIRIFFAAIILSFSAIGADINVPNGQSIGDALAGAVDGDRIILESQALYDERVRCIKSVEFVGNGARVSQFSFEAPNITLKNAKLGKNGLTPGSQVLTVGRGAHNSVIENVQIDLGFQDVVFGIYFRTSQDKPFGDDAPSNCIVRNVEIKNGRATTMLTIAGDNNVFRDLWIHDGQNIDFIRIFGRNNLIENSLFENQMYVAELGNHPDFIQTFGDNSDGSLDHIIRNNVIRHIRQGQICQLTNALLPQIGGFVFYNNIFYDIDLQASCSIPNVKWFNNLFSNCNLVNQGHVLALGSRDYTEATSYDGTIGTSYAHGAQVVNNIFWNNGNLDSDNAGWYGMEAGLNNLFANNNFVSKNGNPVRAGTVHVNDPNYGFNDTFRFSDPNGINGGFPGFRDLGGHDFHLTPTSILIDRGIFSAIVEGDHDGKARMNQFDIGPYEFSASLLNKPFNLQLLRYNQ